MTFTPRPQNFTIRPLVDSAEDKAFIAWLEWRRSIVMMETERVLDQKLLGPGTSAATGNKEGPR